MAFAHPLKTYRALAGVGVGSLADKLGISRQTVYRIETYKQTPSLGLVSRICALTGLSADDFLISGCPAPNHAAAGGREWLNNAAPPVSHSISTFVSTSTPAPRPAVEPKIRRGRSPSHGRDTGPGT